MPNTGDTFAFLCNNKFGIDTYRDVDSIAQHYLILKFYGCMTHYHGHITHTYITVVLKVL